MTVNAPTPYGPTPSPRQLKWHATEIYGFIHFTINTFTDKEWGYGDESPALFAPTEFDADQIADTAAKAGLKGLVITCKHHDGFCLWPSEFTEHSVKNSPWKDGKGDMVREFSEACAKHGLQFGVYLSPWDRNHPDYGEPEYLDYYRAQLRELLTNYGTVFEMWFDGANGGDGYYGGANEKRSIDNSTYYDWDNTWKIVRELQPDACMFSDGGPDIRWVGNESGWAGEPCWSTIDATQLWPGHGEPKHLNIGDRDGTSWLPAEVDVSIRPGWFYHEREDSEVRSVSNLTKIYFESVGRGANLILNLPPDRRGLVHEIDVANLVEWNRLLSATFATDLAHEAKVTASNVRGDDEKFAPSQVLDSSRDTYWATDDNVLTPELVLDLGKPVSFNVVRLREFLPLGQRVGAFALDYWNEGKWQEFAAAANIGNQRLVQTETITTTKARLRITEAAACPAISELALFTMPLRVAEPTITRSRDGLVSIAAEEGSQIRYTTDGGEPVETSPLYEAPFALHLGGTVKAKAFEKGQPSELVTAQFTVSKAQWKVVSFSSATADGPALNAIDENPKSLWKTEPNAAQPEIVVDLGETLELSGFNCLPRQDRFNDGTPDRYEFSVSADGVTWNAPAVSGEFSNIKSNRVLQTVLFDQAVTGRFFRLAIPRVVDNAEFSVLAEIGVIYAA